MFTLILFLISVAVVAATAAATASRPLDAPVPVEASLPAAALGLSWRRKRELSTRNGRRALWIGDGSVGLYRRAYDLARDGLRGAGFSWTEESQGDGVVSLRPCCWEPVPADDAATQRAIAEAEAAVAADDERLARAEQMRREFREAEALRVADYCRGAVAALRESLDKKHWAWPVKKRAIAEVLLREPFEVDDVPKIAVADLALKLVAQVDKAIAKVRERIARDPAHDWLARAQDPDVRRAVKAGVQILCEMDEDRASLQNGYGWGKSHSHAGHVLRGIEDLSVIEGSQALAAVWRHRKQISPALRERCFGSAEA